MKSIFIFLLILILFPAISFSDILLDNLDDNITLSSSMMPNVGADQGITVAAWIKTTSTTVIAVQLQNSFSLIYMGVGILAGFGTANKATCLVRFDGALGLTGASGSTSVNDGNWHYIACEKSGDDLLNIFVDGVQENQIVVSNLPMSLSGGADRYIGSNGTATLDGLIKDVAIWYNTNSTGATVKTSDLALIYQSRMKRQALQIDASELRAVYPVDDCADGVSGDGVIFRDISGHGYDGVGNDGTLNTGLTCRAETLLTYQ